MHQKAVVVLVAAASCLAGASDLRTGLSGGSRADSLLEAALSDGQRWTGLKAIWLASAGGAGNPPPVVPAARAKLPAPAVGSRPTTPCVHPGSSTALFVSRGYLPYKGWLPPEEDKPKDLDVTEDDGQDVYLRGTDAETTLERRLSDEELVQRTATDTMDFVYDVTLPPQWDSMIVEGGISLASMSPRSEVWTARLRNCDETVSFKVMRSDDVHAQRELHMRTRMQDLVRLGAMGSAGLTQTLDMQVYETNTYFLFRTAGGNLRTHLNQRRAKQASSSEPLMLPNVALNMLVDLLHGCENLDRAGIVHADLTEHNILLSQGRAYITDFSTACLVHSGDQGVGCDAMEDAPGHLVGSAYHKAPEMVRGRPTGPENHVWQLGLVFAEIFLGFPPMGLLRTFHEQPDSDEAERARIERLVREEFRIEYAPGFGDADSGVKELLLGMLEKRVSRRWTASATLEYVRDLCARTGIALHPRDDGDVVPAGN